MAELSVIVPRVKKPRGRSGTGAFKDPEIGARARRASALARQRRAALRKLDETKVHNVIKQQILGIADNLVRAANVAALGCTYVYKIERKKNEEGRTVEKNVLITDPQEIAQALDAIANDKSILHGQYVFLTTDKPDFRAVEMLLNRVFGKPSETKKLDITKRTYSLVDVAQRSAPTLVEAKIKEG